MTDCTAVPEGFRPVGRVHDPRGTEIVDVSLEQGQNFASPTGRYQENHCSTFPPNMLR